MSVKNDINDKIDWSNAHAVDGKQNGYSYIGVEGLSPHRYRPDDGSKHQRGCISTDGRLVLWLGNNPDGSPNFGYFNAAEILAQLQRMAICDALDAVDTQTHDGPEPVEIGWGIIRGGRVVGFRPS